MKIIIIIIIKIIIIIIIIIIIKKRFFPKYLLSLKYTERKKKRRVNFIPKFHSSLKKFVKYFYKTVHVWNKSSKFHWFVINKSRVIEVHW